MTKKICWIVGILLSLCIATHAEDQKGGVSLAEGSPTRLLRAGDDNQGSPLYGEPAVEEGHDLPDLRVGLSVFRINGLLNGYSVSTLVGRMYGLTNVSSIYSNYRENKDTSILAPAVSMTNEGTLKVVYQCSDAGANDCPWKCSCKAAVLFVQEVGIDGAAKVTRAPNFMYVQGTTEYGYTPITGGRISLTWLIDSSSKITTGWQKGVTADGGVEVGADGPKIKIGGSVSATWMSQVSHSQGQPAPFPQVDTPRFTKGVIIQCKRKNSNSVASAYTFSGLKVKQLKASNGSLTLDPNDLANMIVVYDVLYDGSSHDDGDNGIAELDVNAPPTPGTGYGKVTGETPLLPPLKVLDGSPNKKVSGALCALVSDECQILVKEKCCFGDDGAATLVAFEPDELDRTFQLSVFPPGVVEIPSSLVLAAGESRIDFALVGLSAGEVTITASGPEGSEVELTIEVDILPAVAGLSLGMDDVMVIEGDRCPEIRVVRGKSSGWTSNSALVSVSILDPDGILDDVPQSLTIEAASLDTEFECAVTGIGIATVTFSMGAEVAQLLIIGESSVGLGLVQITEPMELTIPADDLTGWGIRIPVAGVFHGQQTLTCTVVAGSSLSFLHQSLDLVGLEDRVWLPVEIHSAGTTTVTVSLEGVGAVTFNVTVIID